MGKDSLHGCRVVDQCEIVQEWLQREQNKSRGQHYDIASSNAQFEMEACLLAHKPGAARSLLTLDYSWVECEIPPNSVGDVYTIFGPPQDRPTVSEAFRLFESEKLGFGSEGREKIRQLMRSPPEEWGKIIIAHRRYPFGRGSPYLLDGNHRAIAIAGKVANGEEVASQRAYVGYPGICGHRTAQLRRWVHIQFGWL